MPPTSALPPLGQRRAARWTRRSLLWLEALLAIGAFAGAVGLITGGVDLGEVADDLPFGSTAFGGWALLLVNGALPTAVVIAALRRRSWAELGHLAVGIALIGWIMVQISLLGWPPHWLQVLYLLWGWVILALAVWRWRSLAAPSPANRRGAQPSST
ncbi:MAG: hypothetical protein ACLFS9_06925 [Nitriliruptoraceae bacterium]